MKFSILKDEQVPIDEKDPFADIAQTERIGLGDLVIAAVLAVATYVMLSIWGFPTLHPSVWEDVAVANGIRPKIAKPITRTHS